MNTFQVMHVQDYNRLQEGKWRENWEKHQFNTQADFYTAPQLAFYVFSNNRRDYRHTGYVAFGEHKAIWRKTKKAAIAEFEKQYIH